MLQIVFLGASIALLIVVQQLRALLAYVFPRYRARALPPNTPPPAAAAALFEAARTELAALGFDGPHWFLRETDDPLELPTWRVTAMYRHPVTQAILCLGLPCLSAPDRLAAFAVTRLEDSSHAVSQAFDSYFTLLARDVKDLRAQAIAPASLTLHYQAHLSWLSGIAPRAAADSTTPADLLDLAGAWMNRLRDALVARGRLWCDRAGVRRARLGYALRMLLMIWRRPKPPANKTPLDAARLGLFALAVERVRDRVPAARTQWLLFGLSVVLFALAGAVVWNPQLAMLLLLVIGFHEFGHYAAMRVFGYRNVHMLALPLVGGVTIGHETTPSAARRAWMSLMGPLPGILLGWTLLLLGGFGDSDGPFESWRVPAATMLLVINYINLLPIPPLDGGRVVQAMLPPRWHGVQAGFIAVACVGGGLAALWTGMTVIAVLALVQLNGLPQLLQNGRVLKALLAEGAVAPAPRAVRMRRVLDQFERVAGPAKTVRSRIVQAEAVLYGAEQVPMGWLQRTLLACVLLVVLVVPLGAAAVAWLAVRDAIRPVQTAAQIERGEQQRREYQALVARAPRMTLADLIAGVQQPDFDMPQADMPQADAPQADAPQADAPQAGTPQAGTPQAGASEDELAAAQARLGRPLPQELGAVLRLSNGIDAIGLGAAAQIGTLERKQLQRDDSAGTLDVWADGPGAEMTHVPLARAQQWLRLSAPTDEPDMLLCYDDGEPPAVPGHRVIEVAEGEGRAYADLRALLQERWLAQQSSAQTGRQLRVAIAAERERLRSAPTAALLADLPRPSLFARLVLHTPDLAAPASAAQLAAAERRIGRALPAEMADVYRLHDGLRLPPLLPVERLERAPSKDDLDQIADYAGYRFAVFDAELRSSSAKLRLSAADVQPCLAFGANWREGKRSAATEFWCPAQANSPERWISLRERSVYPSFRAWLLDNAAQRTALSAELQG